MSRPPRDATALLRCADILGAFGVTAADVRRETTTEDALEDALADVLADGRDRRAVLRRTIARSDRGLSCSARYARETLEQELRGVFESIGWSFDLERVDARAPQGRRQLRLRASDYHDRRRETTFEYPETPLGTDNLPAVLWAIDDVLLSGTDARFVLLSAGVDRWQAALIDEHELERLRERYGPRLAAVERPVLPEYVLDDYVPIEDAGFAEPAAPSANSPDGAGDPWPAWADERERDGSEDAATGVESLIEEAEDGDVERNGDPGPESSDRGSEGCSRSDGVAASSSGATTSITTSSTDSASSPNSTPPANPPSSPNPTPSEPTTTSEPAMEVDGFELRGSPAVSRVSNDGESARDDGQADFRSDSDGDSRTDRTEPATDTATATDAAADTDSSETTDEFGTLSGTTTTARVSNDSFGSEIEWESEDDRYRALGAALGAGGNVSVRGLLEDDDFLPEIPPAEPDETRIAFQDPFDPGALREAKAAAEQSGFVWVDSGSLETTRISNG